MSVATGTALCRVTVLGPDGRADLAVPTVTSVGELIPTLIPYVVDEQRSRELAEYGSWVLQRLGEEPMDPDGTPETLDWLDGERLYLVPAENPLPELDFDDIADGMATVISRHTDRWDDLINRRMFLGLTGVGFATVGAALVQDTGTILWAVVGVVLAVALVVVAALVARLRRDGSVAAIVGIAACGYAGLAGLLMVQGGTPLSDVGTAGVLAAALGAIVTAAVLLSLQRTLTPQLPIVPFGIVAVIGFGAIVAVWLAAGIALNRPQAATVMAIVAVVLLVVAPKIATRSARLRGPQLPKSSDELQIDIEPYPASQITDRVKMADSYLTVLVAGACVIVCAAMWYLLDQAGWATLTVAGLVSALMLLRSREFRSVPQRLFLVFSGATGAVLLIWAVSEPLAAPWRLALLAALLLGNHTLFLAALRPSTRRLLPIWGHLANMVETFAAIALVPLLFYLLGLFAWARGLAG